MNTKKLYKSKEDRKLCGVCGGLAEYFGIDSTIVRLVWVLLVLFAGCGILAYIVAALVMPDEPAGNITVVDEDRSTNYREE